jgi:hypothetical protein
MTCRVQQGRVEVMMKTLGREEVKGIRQGIRRRQSAKEVRLAVLRDAV